LVRDLNFCYRSKPALHARDCEGEGFQWLIADDAENSVYAWLRMSPGEKPVAVISNFTPVYRENFRIPLPIEGRWREILNTDAEIYGGSGKGNGGRVQAVNAGGTVQAEVTLPPLATIMLELEQA
jgi:1,4-alpha-glucan branching enzyme